MKLSKISQLMLTLFILSTCSLSISAQGAKVSPLLSKKFNNIKGKEGAMLLVEYAPGESSRKHRHDAHSFVYVLEGEIVMQLEGMPPQYLIAGDTFYESPEDIHLISSNASDTHPAKFLVFSVKETDKPILTPVN